MLGGLERRDSWTSRRYGGTAFMEKAPVQFNEEIIDLTKHIKVALQQYSHDQHIDIHASNEAFFVSLNV